MRKFGIFVTLGVNLRFFQLENSNYLLEKAILENKNECQAERFQHSNLRSRSKFDKNCIKTLKIGNFLVFCHFVSISNQQKAHLSLLKRLLRN